MQSLGDLLNVPYLFSATAGGCARRRTASPNAPLLERRLRLLEPDLRARMARPGRPSWFETTLVSLRH